MNDLNQIPVSSLTQWELKSLKVWLGWPDKPGNPILNTKRNSGFEVIYIQLILLKIVKEKSTLDKFFCMACFCVSFSEAAKMLKDHFDKYTVAYFSIKNLLFLHINFVSRTGTC